MVQNPEQDDVLKTMEEDFAPPTQSAGDDESPGFQIAGESRIPVSKYCGKMWKQRKDAAVVSGEVFRWAHNEAYRYFNNDQGKREGISTTKGFFHRGDTTENIVFSNVQTILPATYSKNPDIAFSTSQDEDKEQTKLLQIAVNNVIRKKTHPGVDLKPHMQKCVLHTELTNFGILKLDMILKDDSTEFAMQQMEELFQKSLKAKDVQEVREIEGEMLALESTMEWRERSGFKINNVVSSNLLVDPNAERKDGLDSKWMMERCFIATETLNAKFTQPDDHGNRSLIYKPTHRVKFKATDGAREDALGPVMEAISSGEQKDDEHTNEQRMMYIYENMTECYYVWDKATRRIFLFQGEDWTWPIWVWDDYLGLSRFFPYYILQFAPSTGGVLSVGEASYYLDQQDEINQINRELMRIRRTVFRAMVYNSKKITQNEVKKLVNFLMGDGSSGDGVIGVDVPDGMSISDTLETIAPPSIQYDKLFDKGELYAAIDRISANSDALRGVQFKANTTEDAVEALTSASRVRIGIKVDANEDLMGDLGWGIAELLTAHGQGLGIIEGLLGSERATEWRPQSVEQLNSTTSIEVAAGTTEKPTSVFKKKEAIQIVQAIGQFASAAPGATLRIMLRVLSNAFTEVNVTDKDWEALQQEIQANLSRGQSAPAGEPNGASGVDQMPQDQARQMVERLRSQVTQGAG